MLKHNRLLIIILTLIMVILIVLQLLGTKKPLPISTPTILPTPTSTPSPVPQALSPSAKQGAIKKLPLMTDHYTIEYLPVEDKFIVEILQNPYLTYKNDVVTWFQENGIGNLSQINIDWGTARGVIYQQ